MHVKSLPLSSGTYEVAPWIEGFARVGFAAKGVLYLTISTLTAGAALGLGGKPDADLHEALRRLFHAPFGRLLVGIVALGLLGYAAWRILEGITDPQGRGHDAKALAQRAGSIGRGLIHLVLAGAAGAYVVYSSSGSSGGERTETWTARTLAIPGGIIALWLIAGGLLAYGLYQLYRAHQAKLSRQLLLGRIGGIARRAIVGISRFGTAARGIVFCTIAVLLARAAHQHDPQEAGGVGDSMRELLAFGVWPYLVIALGLGAYGIYELVNARYRRIDVP